MMVKKLSKLLMVLLLLVTVIMFVDCVPPPATETGESSAVEEQVEFDRNTCDRYLSFAYSYYQNQDWKGCIKNYKQMVDNNCGEAYAEDIYSFYGRAYRELGSINAVFLDSALYIYQMGLEYLPDNEYLQKNVAYIYQLQGKTDLQIREYEKIAERNPDNVKNYQQLVKLYFSTERYNDVLWGVNQILELNPGDEQANNDRMTAYEKLGKDVIEVQKSAWESTPTTRTGFDYATALEDRNDYADAIQVLKQVTALDRTDFGAWEKLGNLYVVQNDNDNAVNTFIHISNNISQNDIKIFEKIINGYIALGKYEKGFQWATKAIKTNREPGLSYKLRGDVYYAAIEYYISDREITFEDKLAFKLTYNDYQKAYSNGERSVKSRLDYLKQYRIPTSEDWFVNKYNPNGSDRTNFRPNLPEYSWITESVKK